MRFIDSYPTPGEVAETMKDQKAGIIGLCQTVFIDSERGCASTDPKKISATPYSGDAGDETE